MEKYIDEYGFITKIDELLNDEEYTSLNIADKNKFLMQTINTNNELLNSISTPVVAEEYQIKNKKASENLPKINKSSPKLSSELKRKIEDAQTSEELLKCLPDKGDVLYQNKLARIKCELRLDIDIFDNLIYTTDEEDMKNYLLESRRELQDKLNFILDIESDKKDSDIIISPDENVDIFYFNYNGTNLVISDLLGEDTEKYPFYTTLLQSIKNQAFKGIKKITKQFCICSLYQVRFGDQRIIFDYIDRDKIIIIQAFTKKVKMDKKYRSTTEGRFEKYLSVKDDIIKRLKNDEEKFREEGIRDNEAIEQLLKNKNKTLAKRNRNGKIN